MVSSLASRGVLNLCTEAVRVTLVQQVAQEWWRLHGLNQDKRVIGPNLVQRVQEVQSINASRMLNANLQLDDHQPAQLTSN